MRCPVIAAAFLWPSLVFASAAPVRVAGEFDYSTLRLAFDRPMLTWSAPARSSTLRITPDAGCTWAWTDDTTLECWSDRRADGLAFAPATAYTIEVGEGLWTQSGVPVPPLTLVVDHAPPTLEAEVRDWVGGEPVVRISSPQPVTEEAIRAVLSAHFDNIPASYRLVPVAPSPYEPAGTVAFEWIPDRWPQGPARLQFQLAAGLVSLLGPVRGRADPTLLDVGVHAPFRWLGIDCGQGFVAIDSPTVGRCGPDADIALLFSRRLSAQSRRDVAESLPPGLSLAKETDQARRYFHGNTADTGERMHVLRLESEASGRDLFLSLPPMLVSEDGAPLAKPVQTMLSFGPHPGALSVVPGASLALPGQGEVAQVEARNLHHATTWREWSISTVIRDVERRLRPERRPEIFVDARAARPSRDMLANGGLSLGGAVDLPSPGRATARPAFSLLAHAYGNTITAWATEWADGTPVTDASVDLFDVDSEGREIRVAIGRTDSNGIVVLTVPANASGQRVIPMLRASQGRRVSVLPVASFSDLGIGPTGPYRYTPDRDRKTPRFGVTDRLVYRPGDTVNYRLWLRARQGNHLVMPERTDVKLALGQAWESPLREWHVAPDSWGSIAGDLRLPERISDGGYCIDTLGARGTMDTSGGACFDIRRFDTQALWARLAVPGQTVRPGDRVSIGIEGGYFSGGQASGARFALRGVLAPLDFSVAYPAFSAYRFARAEARHASEADPLADAVMPDSLDDQGRVRIPLTLPRALEWSDGDGLREPVHFAELRLNAELVVSSQSGAFSPTGRLRIAAHPAYVGLRSLDDRPEKGATPMLEAVVVGFDGQPHPGTSVRVRAETRDGNDEVARVLGHCGLVAGTPSTCDIDTGEAHRVTYVAESDEAAETRLDLWFGGRGETEDAPSATIELLSPADRGLPARVRLRQPHGRSAALFVLEYDGVLRHWTREVGAVEDMDVELSPELAPGATLRVLLRPITGNAADGLEAPTLSTALRLDVPVATRGGLELTLDTPALAPGQTLRLRLRNGDVRSRLVVLAVVDDAVHQQMVERHEALSPSRHNFLGTLSNWDEGRWHGFGRWERVPNLFYRPPLSRSRLGHTRDGVPSPAAAPVDFSASDVLDTVEVTGSRIRREDLLPDIRAGDLLPTSSGGPAGPAGPRVRRDFRESAYWNPGVVLAPGEFRELSIRLPDNLTRWRVLAWSGDDGDGFDLAQAVATTSLPVELRFGLPARLFEGDHGVVGVSGRNTSSSRQPVALEVATEGPGFRDLEHFHGELAPGAALTGNAPLLPKAEGAIMIVAHARSPEGMDALSSSIPVRSRWADVTIPQAGWLVGPVSLRVPELPAGARDARIEVGLTQDTHAWRDHWLDDLRDYPHRCWEQTLARAVGAALALQDGKAAERWEDAAAVVAQAFDEAPSYQDFDGHFHFFPPTDDSSGDNLLLNAHTLRQFGRLRALGQTPPPAIHDALRKAVEEQLTSDDGGPGQWDAEAAAVAVAALATQGIAPPDAVLSRLWRQWPALSWHARSELVLALHGSPAFAVEAGKGVDYLRDAGDQAGLRRVVRDIRDFGYAMGSSLRDQCAITATLWQLDREPGTLDRRRAFLRGIADLYAGGTRSQDTQASVQCLWALRAAADENDVHATHVDLKHGSKLARRTLDGDHVEARWQAPAQAGQPLVLQPSAGSAAALNYVATLTMRQDLATIAAAGVGLSLHREYAVLRNGRWQSLGDGTVHEGEWVRVSLRVEVGATRYFVAITDSVPGGLSTRDVDLEGVADARVRAVSDTGSWWFDTRQTGTDEVRLYARVLPPGSHEVHYFAQATYAGRYLAAPAVAELMYGRASRANSAATWVKIQPQP